MGSKQLGFSDYEQTTAKKRTRRERFLAEMESVVPWKALIELNEPHYPGPASRVAGRPTRWRRCCGSICCSSGMT
jgi:IS5 family transposase